MSSVVHDRTVTQLAEEAALGHVEQILGSQEAGSCGLALLTSQDQIDGVG